MKKIVDRHKQVTIASRVLDSMEGSGKEGTEVV